MNAIKPTASEEELDRMSDLSTPAGMKSTSGNKGVVRATVIGTGKISEEHLNFLSTTPGIELAAVCDLSPALAAFSARKFRAQAHFTDYAQMLRKLSPDVVHVLTPAQTHLAVASHCLDAGAHVIVEKPAALSSNDLKRLTALASECGRWVIEDHNYRFNRSVNAIEAVLARGELGEVREVDVRLALNIRAKGGRYADENLPHPSHRLPAGVIHEFITHMAYLTLRFLPGVERVQSNWNNYGKGGTFLYDDLDAIAFAGSAHARLRFTCMTLPESFTITIRGSKGWAETDLFQPYLRLVTQRPGGKLSPLVNHAANGCAFMRAAVAGFKEKLLQNTPYHGLHAFLAQTYSAIRCGKVPPVTYTDMERASWLVDSLLNEDNRR